MLVTLPSPHPGAPARPSTPEVLRTRESAPNSLLFDCFHIRLTFEFIKGVGSSSQMVSRVKNLVDSQVCNTMQTQGVCKTIQRNVWVESRNKSAECNLSSIEGILKSWHKKWKKCYKGKRPNEIFEILKVQIKNSYFKLNWLSTKSILIGCEKYSQISRNNLKLGLSLL
jgi:hypothetical protein